MKKILMICATLLCLSAGAAPYDFRAVQMDSVGNAMVPRFLPFPVSGTCLIGLESANQLTTGPSCLQLSGDFTVSSGALSLSAITSGQVTTALGYTPYDAANPSGYITSSALSPYLTSFTAASTYATSSSVTSGLAAKADTSALTSGLAGKQATVALTTTGSGAATFNPTTGALNIPTPSAASQFNFSQPASRTLAVSTSYQATDPSKAAIIYPSYACQNATQVLASSACTMQVRIGTSALTCSTGTVYYTQSLTVGLGLLLTQNSTNPVPIMLPTGAHFILCATAGTFTITANEQSAG